MNKCTVADLRKMTFDKHIKPYKFHSGGIDTAVDDWSHFMSRIRTVADLKRFNNY